MTAAELRTHLSAAKGGYETLTWLQDSFLPSVARELNTSDVRRRLGIFGGEKIPENERNLTDVRNRVSLIIEYEMARVGTQLLTAAGVDDFFLSYVVANRFPDLEVRDLAGRRGLRFEVKCLQSIAEEKAANFDALKKDLNPNTDFLVVFLWEWEYEYTDVVWDRAPKVLDVFCFHATSIAHLRDWYWLNKPPRDLGRGLQGFDLRHAVNCKNGKYSEEEGNYGKLLRIWVPDFEYPPPKDPLISKTESDYLNFKVKAIRSGFDSLVKLHMKLLSTDEEVSALPTHANWVGWRSGNVAFILPKPGLKIAERMALLAELPLDQIVWLDEKYRWTHWKKTNGLWAEAKRGSKPKHLTTALGRAENL